MMAWPNTNVPDWPAATSQSQPQPPPHRIRRQRIAGTIGTGWGVMDMSVFTIACEGDEVVIRRGKGVEVRIRVREAGRADVDALTDGSFLPFRVPNQAVRSARTGAANAAGPT